MRDRLPRILSNTEKLEHALKTKPERFWIKRGEDMALELFHEMSQRVPAYKDFLKRHLYNPASVKTIQDFKKILPIDKDNYLRKYPLKDLCWDGELPEKSWVISATSGSTGEPFYFPRTDIQDEYYALTAELYLRSNFGIDKKTTLYIDAFAMGAWIGGLFTYEAVKKVAEKGYSLSIITPGINKHEVINEVRRLGPHFDQVIIGSYPPILKDIIDIGIEEGLNWSDYNLGVVFSAEGFSENFRDYIAKHAKLANIYTSTLNHYGTVDLGTMSHETPASIMVRRQAVKDKELFKGMFGAITKLPTLTQYLPELFYFEEAAGKLYCSSYSGLPLVRYDLKDNGGILTLNQVQNLYKKSGKNFITNIKRTGLENTLWNLPLVYLYERSDFSVTLVGAIIHAEEIRKALLEKAFHRALTGKFTMEVKTDRKQNSKLIVNLELRRNVSPSSLLSRQIRIAIVKVLLEENTEYTSNYATYGSKIWPKIIFWPNEHALHFDGKGKQKWVKK